jgi:hypothetical protein
MCDAAVCATISSGPARIAVAALTELRAVLDLCSTGRQSDRSLTPVMTKGGPNETSLAQSTRSRSRLGPGIRTIFPVSSAVQALPLCIETDAVGPQSPILSVCLPSLSPDDSGVWRDCAPWQWRRGTRDTSRRRYRIASSAQNFCLTCTHSVCTKPNVKLRRHRLSALGS